jgi:hypothetical protein
MPQFLLFCFVEFEWLFLDSLVFFLELIPLESRAIELLKILSFHIPLNISDSLRFVFSTGEAVKLLIFVLNASERLILSLSCCCCVIALAVGIF